MRILIKWALSKLLNHGIVKNMLHLGLTQRVLNYDVAGYMLTVINVSLRYHKRNT